MDTTIINLHSKDKLDRSKIQKICLMCPGKLIYTNHNLTKEILRNKATNKLREMRRLITKSSTKLKKSCDVYLFKMIMIIRRFKITRLR